MSPPLKLFIEPLADHSAVIPELANWLYDEWGYLEPLSSPEWVAEKLTERQQRTTVPICFVAFAVDSDARTLVGTVSMNYRELDLYPRLHYWLGSLLVLPSWRKRGIGTALVRHLEQWASGKMEAIHLYTSSEEGFYGHLGWETISRVKHRGEAVAVMRKAITVGNG